LYVPRPASAAGAISAKVVALTEEVAETMFLTKLKMVTIVLLAVSMVAVGGGLVSHQMAIAQPGQAQQPPAAGRKDAPTSKAQQRNDEVKGGDQKAEAVPKGATGQAARQAEAPARLTRDQVRRLRNVVNRPVSVDFPP